MPLMKPYLVLPQFMIQGGDIINFDGTSGESIYGTQFEDENFKLSHTTGGLLSMVNEGYPNSNSSQFVITISASTHLDNTNVVFGKVLKGMGVILEVSQVTTIKDVPLEVKINSVFLFYMQSNLMISVVFIIENTYN